MDLENSQLFSLGKSLPVTASFFKNHLNPSILISCNLNGCYWIPSSTLKSFLVRCTNLEKLHVAETELSIEDIVSVILPKCKKVTSLSFTLRSGDWFSISAHLSKRKKQFLCQLKSVEMMVAHSRQFAEVLNFLQ